MTRILIKQYKNHAGKWIYQGYAAAFKYLGFEVIPFFDKLPTVKADDIIMATDADVVSQFDKFERAQFIFLHVQPTFIPHPWGMHPNFHTALDSAHIQRINTWGHIIKWNFGHAVVDYFRGWQGHIHFVPLAFDSLNYQYDFDKSYQYDVCFVGGWANNGFDEKRSLILSCFQEFMKSGLHCGFFVDANVSHEKEQKILSSSRVGLNLHDVYQRVLGNDTNERTFKTLGLTGCMVSDYVKNAQEIIGRMAIFGKNDREIVDGVLRALDNVDDEQRELNREQIRANHTYIQRAKMLLELME